MAAKLHVTNIPTDATEDSIRELFATIGTVVSVTIRQGVFTGNPQGLAFVEMASPEETQKAIEKLDGHAIGEYLLTVRMARPGEAPVPYHNRSRPNREVFG